MRVKLPTRMQNVVASFSNAMDVIADTRESTIGIMTSLMFHELFEPITIQLLIFDMVRFVFFCKSTKSNTI